jgi:hypothetical protein
MLAFALLAATQQPGRLSQGCERLAFERAFSALSVVMLLAWAPTAAAQQPGRLSPGCERLESPPALAAAPDLDLSVLEEPHVLTGLLKEPWSPPPDLMQGTRALRVDLMPTECAEAPLKMANGTLIGPAQFLKSTLSSDFYLVNVLCF